MKTDSQTYKTSDDANDFFKWWYNTEPDVLKCILNTDINVRDYSLFIACFGKNIFGVEWQTLNLQEERLVIINPKLYAFAKLRYGF